MVILTMTRASAGSAATCLAMASRSSVSACSLCGLEMLTSGSMIGTRPAARIRSAYSNCWSTIAAMPAWLASLITDRILVPKIPCRLARSSWSSRVSMGFMSWTSSCSAASPRSTLRNGTTFLVSHRYCARGHALDGPLHGLQEQDRREDPRAVERRVRDDPGPHRVDEVEHLVVVAVAVPPDAVLFERLRRAAAALVERGEETAAGPYLLKLFGVHPSAFCHQARGAS